MGFCTAIKQGFEADDVIASLASKAKLEGLNVRIVSHDKDLYQLIEPNVFLFDPIKKKEVKDKSVLINMV